MYYMGDLLSTILVIASLIVTSLASLYINSNYKKYKKVATKCKLTGYDVARKVLDANGLNDVLVLETQGELTDHYDPSNKTVKLSTDIYHNTSIASVAVASHECGHAIQDKEGYKFLRIRHSIVPIANISSKLGYVAIVLGLLLSFSKLIWIGVAAEIVILIFQLVTLPVEFNASNRALKNIEKLGLVDKDELTGSKKMLTSAALTYVAGVLSSIVQVLRVVLMATNRDR